MAGGQSGNMAASALATALDWRQEGHDVCLAAVIACWGSAPRPAGSFLAVRGDGLFAGSVSGGCIEGDVITRAQQVISDGKPVLQEYGVADAKAWEVGLACGGNITIWLAPFSGTLAECIADVVKDKARRKAQVLACNLVSGAVRLLGDDAMQKDKAALEAARQGRALHEEVEGEAWFFRPFLPALRLVIGGAVHIAEPLAAMAARMGYQVQVSDPRGAFVAAARFGGDDRIKANENWPDKTLADIQPDSRTAFAALTHDPKIDDPALLAAMASPCFYIGALGSKKTHAERLERLKAQGADEAMLGRIHAPIGLPLGGRAPAEIAVAILAQITRTLHQQ